MFKPKLIRLVIYLVISIALIVLLVNIPNRESNLSIKKRKDKEGNSTFESPGYILGDFVFVQKSSSTEIPLSLPSNDSLVKSLDAFEIQIDSLGQYHTTVFNLTLNELFNEIRVQKKIRPKLYLKINVNSHSNSEVLMNLIEFASKEKIKIGITKN